MRRRSVLQLGLGALLGASGCASAATLGTRRPSHSFAMTHSDPRFGGFSSLHLAANRTDLLLLGDRGIFAALRLSRGRDQRINGAEVLSITPLTGLRQDPLPSHEADAEGMALGPDGAIYVSFEGRNGGKVWRYPSTKGPATAMPHSPAFTRLPRNGGLEALAMDSKGRLVAMPEDAPGDQIPLYRLEGKAWVTAGELAKDGPFKPTSLDRGPDGALYLLERATALPFGFRSRLSRLIEGPKLSREVLWQSPLGLHGNLEGLSITHTADGKLCATMVADNNHLLLLSNELVEVDLD